MQFRSKPRFIEAIQFKQPGDHDGVVVAEGIASSSDKFVVRGHQGFAFVNPGDWIIAEADGDGFYPCDPITFATNYEPLHEDGTIMRGKPSVEDVSYRSEPVFAGNDFSARVG